MSKRSPDFSRFRTAITRSGVPDCVPFGENDIDIEVMGAILGSPVYDLAGYVSFWKEAGYDYVLLEIRSNYISDSFQKKLAEGVVSANNLRSSAGTIFDEASFEEYPWTAPRDVYYRDIDLVRDHLPDGMQVILCIGPLYNGVQRAMGMSSFVTAYSEGSPLLKAVIDKFGEAIVRIVSAVFQREWVRGVWLGDDLAYTQGLMVSPVFLREHIFPYYQKVGELSRRHGNLFIFHSDGRIEEIMEDLHSFGIHAIHPNEPASSNIGDLKRTWGDRFALIGNIDVDLLVRGSPSQVTESVRSLLASAAPGGGFILGSGNSITTDMPLENYVAMLEAGRTYGGYA